MKKLRIKAILAGIVADFGLSIVLGLLIGIGAADTGVGQSEVKSVGFLIMSLVIGLPPVILGGYVAARMARSDMVLNASMVGVFATAFTLLFSHVFPTWYLLANCIVLIPCAIGGAQLAIHRGGKP